MDAARELAQLAEAQPQLLLGLVEQAAQLALLGRADARGPQQQRERDQPRLCAVVEVALEPPPRGVAGGHEPGAGRPQLLHALLELGVEVRDVAAQEPAEERERHQRGGDERGPVRGVAHAGARHGDEQEGQQRADVDGRQLQPLERPRPAPQPDRPREHDDEQHDVDEGAEGGEERGDRVVAADQQEVLRAVAAAELLRIREQQRRHEREREHHVARDHERAVEPRAQVASREAEAEVEEDRAPQSARHEREGVDERRVRGVEREQEPREAEQDHQHADAALRPPPHDVEARPDEAPDDRGPEHRPHRLGVAVLARQLERDHDGARDQRGHDHRAGARRTHPRMLIPFFHLSL